MTTRPRYESRYAIRPTSGIRHIVTGVGVDGWHQGMSLTTECGVKRAIVLQTQADSANPDPRSCKRCLATLGWPSPRQAG